MNVTVVLLCKRFQQNHFERLVAALQLETYICHQRTVCPAAEALLILLHRLAYPNRWCELAKLFGRAEPELSMIFNEVCIMFNWYKYLHSCQERSKLALRFPTLPPFEKSFYSLFANKLRSLLVALLGILPSFGIACVLPSYILAFILSDPASAVLGRYGRFCQYSCSIPTLVGE